MHQAGCSNLCGLYACLSPTNTEYRFKAGMTKLRSLHGIRLKLKNHS